MKKILFLAFIVLNFGCSSQSIPNSISDLRIWLRADSGVVTFGTLVDQWTDLSGNNNNFIAPNSGVRPELVSNSLLNNEPYIYFNGSKILESINTFSFGNATIFIVAENNTGDPIVGRTMDHAYNTGFWCGRGLANNVGGGFNENVSPFGNFNPVNFNVPYILTMRREGAIVYSFLNSLPFNTPARSTSSTTTVQNKITIGGSISYGDLGNKDVFEIIIYNRALNDSEKQIIEQYLTSRYTPILYLGPDLMVNDLCPVILSVPNGFSNFVWSTGESTQSIVAEISGNYWIQATDPFGNIKSDTILVSLPSIPQPVNTGICLNGINTWSADMGPGFSYLWSTGATTPSIDISTPGTYSVEVTGPGGCTKNSGNYTFSIDNYSQTAFLGNDTTLCSGNLIDLQIGASETEEYFWNGTSTAAQPPFWEVDTTGIYYLESVNVNGCIAQDTIHVTIIGTAPTANFSVVNVCDQTQAMFVDNSIGAGGDPVTIWDWDFGDGNSSSLSDPQHLYGDPGNYLVELYVESAGGCGAFFTAPVEVYELPTASFSMNGFCSGEGSAFVDQSTPGDSDISGWLWNFGQPSSGLNNTAVIPNPSKEYGETGSFNVTLQVTDANNCVDDTVRVITINQSPSAIATVSEACQNAPFTFTNSSTIAGPNFIQSQLWDFGDNTFSILPTPNKSFASIGNHLITLTVTADNGCTDVLTLNAFTHAIPVPNFSVGPACVGTYTTFNDISQVATGSVGSSDWTVDLVNALSGSPASFIFETSGSHNVELTTVSDFGCTADTMIIVNVNPELNASFSAQPAVIVANEPVTFENTSTGGQSWYWELGDGSSSTDNSPENTYDASYVDQLVPISLVASNSLGCVDTTIQYLVVASARFDLAVTNLFVEDEGGYYVVGVQLKNVGTSLIESVDVELRLSNGSVLFQTYPDTLQSGQSAIMVFDSYPSSFISDQDEVDATICAIGTPYSALGLPDENFTNNRFCRNIEGELPVLIGPDPNPATEQFSFAVLITSESVVNVELIDSRGRLVRSFYDNATLPKGLYSFTVPLEGMGSGVYFLRMNEEVKRVVIE